MPRGNGQACCILGVCCRSGSEKQREALATALESLTEAPDGSGRSEARVYADWIIDNFDLAPGGTLEGLKLAVAKEAREHPDANV